jgi:acetolactate synthase-1/2/3 large subunit
MTQESRQMEILRPAAKELIRVEAVHRVPELVRRAFAVATVGRPGPVVLDIPEDVCHGRDSFSETDFYIDAAHKAAPALRCRPSAASLEAAAAHLAKAKRPLILAGGGVHISQAAETLQAFAEAQAIPVAHTMTGKGAIACTHPLNAGLFGRYDRIANGLIEEADCLLVIGCKLGEIATKRFTLPLGGKPLIHLDILAEEFGRTSDADCYLWGDAREGIVDLGDALSDRAAKLKAERADYAATVTRRMAEWRASVDARLTSSERPINMARLMHELNRVMPEDGCLVADGGFAGHWGGLLYDTKRPGRGFVPDRGFASIGYGLPGAMGAKLAVGERPVVGLTGDGGFNMMLGELETVRRLGLDITLVVVNNAASGYVKAMQHAMYGEGSYQSSDLVETDYAAVAQSMGCRGIRVEDPERLGDALGAALAHSGSATIIDVVVTRDPGKMLPGVDARAG